MSNWLRKILDEDNTLELRLRDYTDEDWVFMAT